MQKGALREEMERRQSIRLEKTLPVRFELPDLPSGPRTFEALSRDIGEGGAFIESNLVQDECLPLGPETILNLEIELLGQAKRIKPRAQIVWISKKSRSPRKIRSGFGLKFIQITAQEKKAISLFVSREMLAQTELIEKEIPEILREQKLNDRQVRNLVILDAIRKSRLISRAEISKNTNINIVTVSNYLDIYLRKGLVFERGLDISTGGRRPELVEINPQYGYVVGVDLGSLDQDSASMQAVVTDFTSHLKTLKKAKRGNDNIEKSLDIVKDLIAEALTDDGIEKKRVRGIGIGIGGIMDKFGGTVRNPLSGATFANYVTLKKELENEFAVPVFIENSARCALFAEKWSGMSLELKEAANIIYVFCENQCAIMLRDELYTGSSKSAGQLNFTQDLEMPAATKKEALAQGEKLGAKVASLVNLFNPQVVVIGQAFNQLGDVFLDAIRRTVNQRAFRENANIARIIGATLGEEAVAQGAASLVIESAFANI